MMDVEMASPVGPMIVTNYQDNLHHSIPQYGAEIDLCELLQTMTLSRPKSKSSHTATFQTICPLRKDLEGELARPAPFALPKANGDDAGTEDPAYHSDASESSNSNSTYAPSHIPISPMVTICHTPPACAFLQSILASVAPTSPALSPFPHPYPAEPLQTTGGAYLETILTHRALLSAFPPGHRGCPMALSEIAGALESRAWRADRDSDAEAVLAFRYEAQIAAMWL
ncbi:hypothetical protein BJ138DRAFT_1102178 [Hygrophoropsis aurantiaca]|uniref:Uncharacterized protein n=1 Tax=Hygrophoropsis aurantiaca TaxID=72124 RepID=A0ACB8A997_9AGAM|nr:hypothetical protein BJ138DRAFT_1102178 [Hygrophoropsis aurantiaca]